MWYFGRSKQTSVKLLNEPSTFKQTVAAASHVESSTTAVRYYL